MPRLTHRIEIHSWNFYDRGTVPHSPPVYSIAAGLKFELLYQLLAILYGSGSSRRLQRKFLLACLVSADFPPLWRLLGKRTSFSDFLFFVFTNRVFVRSGSRTLPTPTLWVNNHMLNRTGLRRRQLYPQASGTLQRGHVDQVRVLVGNDPLSTVAREMQAGVGRKE